MKRRSVDEREGSHELERRGDLAGGIRPKPVSWLVLPHRRRGYLRPQSMEQPHLALKHELPRIPVMRSSRVATRSRTTRHSSNLSRKARLQGRRAVARSGLKCLRPAASNWKAPKWENWSGCLVENGQSSSCSSSLLTSLAAFTMARYYIDML